MDEVDINSCDFLLEYITDDLLKEERALFEIHKRDCASCRAGYAEIFRVWQSLPHIMPIVIPPAYLKSQVMNAIFNDPETEVDVNFDVDVDVDVVVDVEMGISATSPEFLPKINKKFWLPGLVAALLLGLWIGTLWDVNNIWKPTSPKVAEQITKPVEVIKLVSLRSFDQTMPAASGEAWLTQQGDDTRIVMRVSNLAPNRGGEAYQAWLIREGNRYNCGTFRVDDQGNGVLTYLLKENWVEFEAIGITLEPDSLGKAPRGIKVLGS